MRALYTHVGDLGRYSVDARFAGVEGLCAEAARWHTGGHEFTERTDERVVERFNVDGVACVFALGGAVCGYVRLPTGHPWRAPDVLADTPFPLAYGPDDDGWVGFDTLGPRHVWERGDVPEPLRSELADRHALFAEVGVDMDAFFAPVSARPPQRWTMTKLRAAVTELAHSVVDAASKR